MLSITENQCFVKSENTVTRKQLDNKYTNAKLILRSKKVEIVGKYEQRLL